MADLGLTALAESLADTARSLDEHIERRAWEMAEPRIRNAEAISDRWIAELKRQLAAEEQRREDLMAEVRRQQAAADRSYKRITAERDEARAVIRRAQLLDTWPVPQQPGEEPARFVFASELWAALNGDEPKETNRD